MSNVLDHERQQQVLALGRLGWPLRRIEAATGIRRETVSGYLRAAGVAVRGRGGQPKEWPPEPAITLEVSTDPGAAPSPGRAPSARACEPYRELIVARWPVAVTPWLSGKTSSFPRYWPVGACCGPALGGR
jgi:hypothetical protein